MDTQNLTGGRLSPLLYQEYDKAGVCNQGGHGALIKFDPGFISAANKSWFAKR